MNIAPGSRLPWFPLPRTWASHAIDTPGSILLETAGGLGSDHTSYLFSSPEKLLYATCPMEFSTLLEDIEDATQKGFYAAGRINYEAAYALHNISATLSTVPLASFGLYRQPSSFDHHSGTTSGPVIPSVNVEADVAVHPLLTPPQIQIDRKSYQENFTAIQQLLADGDTYQVNFTTRVEADLLGPPIALYEALISAQPVDYAAILHLDAGLIFSFSPELFFCAKSSASSSHITTRPMKGTAPRRTDQAEDAAQQEWLRNDEKNLAEHVMIVDLLRNDLGRICVTGSVRADDLFHIEAYPTLFQMVSRVSGELLPQTRFSDIIRALFPSGSITGAPKRRTMEIIRDLESHPREVYTGAIGFVSPATHAQAPDATFSVPIRTLDVRQNNISMGVGGGIVADSAATAEYDECLLKASFLDTATETLRLIETLRWSDEFPLLELHLARLAKSAAQLGFRCNISDVRAALLSAAGSLPAETRVRLQLAPDGSLDIESRPIVGPSGNLRVRIAAQRILSTDPWFGHKTTRRLFYDREFAHARAEGMDEVLFLNERDELAEGAISSLFVELDGRLYTPPLNSGALPGVFRQHLFATHRNLTERPLYLQDLATAQTALLGNAVRGLRSVHSFHIE